VKGRVVVWSRQAHKHNSTTERIHFGALLGDSHVPDADGCGGRRLARVELHRQLQDVLLPA
jgi:hypothetical protein